MFLFTKELRSVDDTTKLTTGLGDDKKKNIN